MDPFQQEIINDINEAIASSDIDDVKYLCEMHNVMPGKYSLGYELSSTKGVKWLEDGLGLVELLDEMIALQKYYPDGNYTTAIIGTRQQLQQVFDSMLSKDSILRLRSTDPDCDQFIRHIFNKLPIAVFLSSIQGTHTGVFLPILFK